MSPDRKKIVYGVVAVLAIALLAFLIFGGESKEEKFADMEYTAELVPTINTDSVTFLVSDSGLIRYKMITQTWLMFDRSKEPYSKFPDGFYAEQFDTAFNVVVTIKSDTAWNYTNRKEWRLVGNVEVVNVAGETFKSEELIWDQRKERIYSSKAVEVIQPNKSVTRGTMGFEANQQMTEYRFFKMDNSELFFEENRDEEGQELDEDKEKVE